MSKFKTLTLPSVGENVEKNSRAQLADIQNDIKPWKTAWQVKLLSKHLIYYPAILLLSIPPKSKICLYNDLCTNIHTNFIWNSQKLETKKYKSTGEYTNVAYSYNGIQLSNHKKWTFDTINNMNDSQNYYAKEARLKRIHIMYINILFHLYKTLECESWPTLTESWSLVPREGKEVGWEGGIIKGH